LIEKSVKKCAELQQIALEFPSRKITIVN